MKACCLAVALLLLGLTNLVAGAAPQAVHNWQTKDGLPQNTVTCLYQSSQGYIWFGTYAGLVRFDGVRFEVIDSERSDGLANDRITAIHEGSDGVLWIGHETGDVTRYDGREMKIYPPPDGLLRSEILEIEGDADGGVWALSREGWLVELTTGRRVLASQDSGVYYNSYGLELDTDGTLWCLRRGVLSTIKKSEVKVWQPAAGGPLENIQAIGAGRSRGLWIAAAGRVRKWEGDQWVKEPSVQPWNTLPIGNLLELRGGELVVASREAGLFVFSEGREVQHFNRTNRLAQDWVRCVIEDAEGTLWVGLGNGGLSAIHAVDFEGVNPPDRWLGRSVLSVTAARDGSVWAGTEGGGLYRWSDGNWSKFTESEGLANRFVWSVLETTGGSLYVGTWSGGIYLWDGKNFSPVPGFEGFTQPVLAMLEGSEGELWIGTANGVVRYRNGKVEWLHEQDGVRLIDVRCMARASDGTMWFGMNGGGLARMQGGRLKLFRKADGLGTDFVSSLHFDQHGVLWIGTAGAGLVRHANGRFARIGSRQGLPSVNLAHIQEDGLGNFWIGSSAGVLRASRADLEACADGKQPRVEVTAYGLGDGLDTTECSGGFQPAGCRTADGFIWFPTRNGLVRVNPPRHSANTLPPPVVIERFQCENENVDVHRGGSGGSLQIPPGRGRFEFKFTALSFIAAEKVRFKYRLVGLEQDWLQKQGERSVTYSYLYPGDYVFEVKACNNEGVWNEAGARLAFTVLPHFWQTWWFRTLVYVLSCVIGGGGVWLETRRRLHRKLERIEQQRALERERARIAKDIHDDLGASLTRITMLSHTARNQLDVPAQVEINLDRIQGTARELTRAMDEIVWAVNPRHDTLDSLATYIFRFAQDFLSPAGIRCRVDVPLELPKWPVGAELRHNVFLAYKEAINNVVRHGNAREVKIALATTPTGFVLCVEDDGHGFDPQLPQSGSRPAGGSGLGNMKSRMDEVGGRVEIESRPGAGTKIAFTIPVGKTC